MKTLITTLAIGLIVAAFIGGYFYGQQLAPPAPQQLTLEQILSIRELHLVKHTYTDLFFLHKKNNKAKAIRAIVQVPVTISAYINLKEVQLIGPPDSIRQIILPPARLNEAAYQVDQMIFRETRSFQLYAGKDLYPQIGTQLSAILAERKDTLIHRAISHRILLQAEAEAKEYVESLLRSVGYGHVSVTFGTPENDQRVNDYLRTKSPPSFTARKKEMALANVEWIPFGFLPLPRWP